MGEGNKDAAKAGPSFTFWFVLCLATIVATLVNQVEMPFARTLVVCDTPIDTSPGSLPSLSNYCGDRLYVIGEGARLSAKAQSLEYICKCMTIVIVGIGADIYGRRPLCIMAIGCVTASCLLFVWASFDPLHAQFLFIVAQGIQGLSGGEMLTTVLFTDLAFTMGTEAVSLFVKKDQILGLTAMLSFWVAIFVAAMELTDYRWVWMVISAANLTGLYFTIAVFPETMPEKKDDNQKPRTLGSAVWEEICAYKTMFAEKPLVKWSLLQAFLAGAMGSRDPQFVPFMMTYFGYTQQMMVVRVVPMSILALVCMGLADKHCRNVGYSKGFVQGTVIMKTLNCTLFPTTPLKWWIAWVCRTLYLPLGGMESIFSNVRNRTVGEKFNAKFQSCQMLVYFLTSSLFSWWLGMMFDERATTYWERAPATLVTTFFNYLDFAVWIIILFPGYRPITDEMDKELAVERAKQAEDAKKMDGADGKGGASGDTKKDE